MKPSDLAGLLILVVLLGGSGWYIYQHRPCAPVSYYIASIDPRFGVSTTTVESLAENGAALWNDAAGKPLLTRTQPSPNAVPVSLVFDERQQAVLVSNTIDAAQTQDQKLRASLDASLAAHRANEAAFERAKTAFTQAADKYDAQIQSVNSGGGATAAQYAQLSAQKQALSQQQSALNAQASALNAESTTLQGQVAAYNSRVQQTNKTVSTFNTTAGSDFNAGEFHVDATGKRISVYEFRDGTQLMRVLSHELGHALGLQHVETADSIMYPYNTSTQTVLTPEDTAELARACALTPSNFLMSVWHVKL